MNFLKKMIHRLQKNNIKSEACLSDATLAQTEGVDHSGNFPQNKRVESPGRNLVIASQNSNFSKSAMDYALDMASRMDYRLIALNATNLQHHPILGTLVSSKDQICRDFKTASGKNAEIFQTKALEKGLEFTHVIDFNGVDHAIARIGEEYGQVEFVVSENHEEERVQDSPRNENRVAQRLCVYSIS